MYCSKCACDYADWTGRCPVDGTLLVEQPPRSDKPVCATVPYEMVVDLLGKNGGSCDIELHTTEVGRERKMTFPFRGYGFAWARKMQGSIDGISVDLQIEEVGTRKDCGFPYQGYGFAWERQMQGWIGGHEINLSATRVAHQKRHLFPFRGHGYSWTEELTGDCGKLIQATMTTTDVGRDKKWFLFYFGFGYAWINRGTLCLSLSGQQS